MEERLQFQTLLFVSFGILLALFAINVQSQQQNGNQGNVTLSPPTLRPPPPPRLSPPPSPSPPPPPPPPSVPPPPSPSPPPPSFSHPPPPPPPPQVAPRPPPLQYLHSPPTSPTELNANSQLNRDRTHREKHSSELNLGQKIGLLFAGIVVILQIGVVGFLAFKRRQLLKTRDR